MLRFFIIILLLLSNNKRYFISLENVRSFDKDNEHTVSNIIFPSYIIFIISWLLYFLKSSILYFLLKLFKNIINRN
jgi:hypothetical protein